MNVRRIPTGLWLYASCKPTALAVDRSMGLITQTHLSLLPQRRIEWQFPFGDTLWRSWLRDNQPLLHNSVSSWVVQLPRDARRQRFNVLLLTGDVRPAAFVKFTKNPANPLAIEAQRILAKYPPTLFDSPQLLSHGASGGWTYTMTSPVLTDPHWPATLSPGQRRQLVSEFQEILMTHLKRPEGPGRFITHGDFGPWNVRTASHGRIVVVDWEETAWGPRATDELWHALSVNLLKGRGDATSLVDELNHFSERELAEAAAKWLEHIRGAQPTEVDSGVPVSNRLARNREQSAEVLRMLSSLNHPE